MNVFNMNTKQKKTNCIPVFCTMFDLFEDDSNPTATNYAKRLWFSRAGPGVNLLIKLVTKKILWPTVFTTYRWLSHSRVLGGAHQHRKCFHRFSKHSIPDVSTCVGQAAVLWGQEYSNSNSNRVQDSSTRHGWTTDNSYAYTVVNYSNLYDH